MLYGIRMTCQVGKRPGGISDELYLARGSLVNQVPLEGNGYGLPSHIRMLCRLACGSIYNE